MYTARQTYVKTPRAIRPLHRLLALLLAAAILATGGTWAAADVTHHVQHGLDQGALPDTPSGGLKTACQHGCIGHLVSHLSAAVNDHGSWDSILVARQVSSKPPLPLILALPSSFFRPPRDFLG